MSRIAVPKPAVSSDGHGRAKLYRSEMHAHQWIAFLPGAGWWVFPDEVNGWSDRRVAVFIDRALLRPVGTRLAAHTGFRAGIVPARVRTLRVSG